MAKELNPLEELTLSLADNYVELVQDLTREFAPVRPWWSEDLTSDQQMWRYLDIRDKVMPWLMQVGAYMGFKSGDEVLHGLEDIFTDESIVEKVPAEVVIAAPIVLLEMVQSNGPTEAAKYIRKMEKMAEGRAEAMGLLDQARQEFNVPEPPDVPPPLPVEAQPGAGSQWPLYGGALKEDGAA